MIGLRVALGILEAGLYPSVVYLLATWYSRCKSHKTTKASLPLGPNKVLQTMWVSDTALSTSLVASLSPSGVSWPMASCKWMVFQA